MEERRGRRRGRRKIKYMHLLWYAGLESFIHWDSPSLIQSDTNILREDNTQEFVS